jgi:purine-binding chemotaxis protein CheW
MTPNGADNVFVFVHRGLQFAVPILDVLEIIEPPALLPPHAGLPGCLGNVAHRDHVLPVLDPTALGTGRAGDAAANKGPSNNIVIVRRDGTVFGLVMDRFVAVVLLEKAPDGRRGAEANPLVVMVCAFRDNVLIVLDVAALADLVRRSFASQQSPRNGERADDRHRHAQAEGERQIFLCARIDRVRFAIAVEHVNEVIEGYDVTPLFKMPTLVRGLINRRGQVLACLDVSGDFGFAPRPLEERSQFVVLHSEGAALALCVDKVTGIRRLPPEQFQKSEQVLSGEMTRYATGVLEEHDGATFLLSVPAVFEAPALLPYRRQEG